MNTRQLLLDSVVQGSVLIVSVFVLPGYDICLATANLLNVPTAERTIMKKMIAGFVLMMSSVSSWAAGGLDIALSNETAYIAILMNPYSMERFAGGTEVAVGAFTNEIGDDIVHGTLLARGAKETASGHFYKLAAGVKLVGGNLEVDESVGALALGFQASLVLAPSNYNPLDLIVEGFFAPSISSFNDAEEYSEVSARIQIDVVPRARAFLGYRRMLFDTDDVKSVTLDRSVHIGLSLTF